MQTAKYFVTVLNIFRYLKASFTLNINVSVQTVLAEHQRGEGNHAYRSETNLTRTSHSTKHDELERCHMGTRVFMVHKKKMFSRLRQAGHNDTTMDRQMDRLMHIPVWVHG